MSGVCEGGKCAPGGTSDKAQNGDETDIDCGGTQSPKCGPGKACLGGEDCASALCQGGKCAAPSRLRSTSGAPHPRADPSRRKALRRPPRRLGWHMNVRDGSWRIQGTASPARMDTRK
jgi:hypothetical protein